jgi:hypothetical protein
MTVREKLEQYDLYDQSIRRHGILDTIRDYEVIGYFCGSDYDLEVQYIFKGCVNVAYEVTVNSEHFSMDDRLLDLNRQDEPDYPDGFIWGAKHAVVCPGWTLLQDTDELKKLEDTYKIRFYQVRFETNAYDLKLTFHDVDIGQLRRIDKK